MRRKLFPAALLLLAIVFPALAAWDPAKPASNGALVSADLRNNWAALGQSVGTVNAIADNQFKVWAAGDAAAPSAWVLTGAGAAVARSGTGLGDTNRKWGAFAAKVTAGGGATAYLSQDVLTTTSYDDGLDGAEIGYGAWVYCSGTTGCTLTIDDGAAVVHSDEVGVASTWTWLTVARTVSASATKITAQLEVAASKTAYLSGPTVVLGPVLPKYPQPSRWVRDTLSCFLSGNQSTGTDKAGCSWDAQRVGIVLDVQLRVKTAPTTQAIIVDLNTWDGAAFTSMYSTRPQIAAAATRGGAAPDSTYARRGLVGQFGASLATGGELSLDVDQVGSGTVGADMTVQVRVLYALRPLEAFRAYNE